MIVTKESLKLYREKSGLSQREAAGFIGVSRGWLALWEAGKHPVSKKHWERIEEMGKLDKPATKPMSEKKIKRIEDNIKREVERLPDADRVRVIGYLVNMGSFNNG